MNDTKVNEVVKTKAGARKTRTAKAPVFVESSGSTKRPFLKQGTTWAGILSIAAAIATGGVSVLTDPLMIAQIGAGIGLLVAEN